MAFKIGFATDYPESNSAEVTRDSHQERSAPRKSMVQVYFPSRSMTLSYYNDRFDLHVGDLVYVDGKLAGILGRVTGVNYSFKIKIADYKQVICLVDTTVHGQFHMANGHFVTFDRHALPAQQILTWFKAPPSDDDVYVRNVGDEVVNLNDLSGMHVTPAIGERGREYYFDNRVRYLSLDGGKGYAIVEGREAYEVEFDYQDEEVRGLTCSCFCSGHCKHEVAVMMQLREALDLIKQHYAAQYEENGYFAAITKSSLFAFAIEGKENGNFTL